MIIERYGIKIDTGPIQIGNINDIRIMDELKIINALEKKKAKNTKEKVLKHLNNIKYYSDEKRS